MRDNMMKGSSQLRLTAQDTEDLSVLAATLQDAILTVGDMVYLEKRNRFAAVLNRFCWEDTIADDADKSVNGKKQFRRVRTGLHFDGVLSVQSKNIERDRKDGVLELLTISHELIDEEGKGEITLIFAGGGSIRLMVECIEASLSDLTGQWPTRNLPDHEVSQ